ncbi:MULTISPECIES: hypothetical protein [unclassified Herbiconiux]|jgi:hypothetical protein|uniref:hypothetical protein n=1 Tax=unclassified Herbiconiux TaxID=2618217 RepID=UPI0015638199|nr:MULTISPECIES: hypothetical protein [unclassified Herbiconiux]MBF4573767.1 hypothetical protein [Herbiconiux sp. VKM Ac-1786]NQX33937.1 hypothetical protein [Herbiconiux sp. VKM Ac-2851]
MSFTSGASTPLFAGPEGLWTADPEELAARLFVTVFAGQGAVPLPQKDVSEVYSTLAGLGGYSLPDVRSGNTQPLGLTVQLAQEAILTWERATVAVRLSAGSGIGGGPVSHTVTMLRFGPGILNAADPVVALKARLH